MLCLQNIDSKIRLYNLSSVIGHLGVTVLPILITLKFVHKNLSKSMEDRERKPIPLCKV